MIIMRKTSFPLSSWMALPESEQWITMPDDMDCSHLCWNSKCVNMEHVIVEPHGANGERKKCALQNNCTGHLLYNCIK